MKHYLIAILTSIMFTAAYSASSVVYMPKPEVVESVEQPQPELDIVVTVGFKRSGCLSAYKMNDELYTCHQNIKWTPGKLEII